MTDKAKLVQDDNTKINEHSINALESMNAKDSASSTVSSVVSKKQRLKAFLRTKKGKIIFTSVAVLAVVCVLMVIPTTRYGTLGLVLKKDVAVRALDSVTKKPVSEATITLGSVSSKTNDKGEAVLRGVSVGKYELKIAKKFYADYKQNYVVPVLTNPSLVSSDIRATGRQITVSVANKVDGGMIAGALVSVSGTTAMTASDGTTTIVLPAESEKQQGTISKEGFNTQQIEVSLSRDENTNQFTIVPAGSLYYLSKSTGKINVMKSNLDGSDSTVVIEGTGQEDDTSTVLLVARDWRYLALVAKRDNNEDRLYLIDTNTGNLTVIDEGAESYQLIGWSGHNFIYSLYRKSGDYWEDKKQALKSFNAETGKIALIDQTVGSGSNQYNYQYEHISSPYILNNEIVYAKTWALGSQYQYQPSNKNMSLVSASPETGNKKVIKDFPQAFYGSIQTKLYKPQELYIRTDDNNGGIAFYEYEHGKIATTTNTNDAKFSRSYPTYLISPSGKKTFWFESRDGKNTIFVGDAAASNREQVAALSDFTPYGWYSDDYILFSKNGSELYIASANASLSETNQPVKVTNYHKPHLSYAGYGYGYGGQ
jgi:hypothetical protein